MLGYSVHQEAQNAINSFSSCTSGDSLSPTAKRPVNIMLKNEIIRFTLFGYILATALVL